MLWTWEVALEVAVGRCIVTGGVPGAGGSMVKESRQCVPGRVLGWGKASILGNSQNPTGYSPEQPVVADHGLDRDLDQVWSAYHSMQYEQHVPSGYKNTC